MATINLRNFYPWYTHDEFTEVSDEIAAELLADKRYGKTHERRMRYNKTYLFDEQTEKEAAAIAHTSDNPEAVFELMERHCRLCQALNSLPEIQGRRIEAHFLLGMSRKEIAEAERVSESAVNQSIDRGLHISQEEYELIQERMSEAGTKNMSAFIRKLALNGYVLHVGAKLQQAFFKCVRTLELLAV